MAKQVVDIGKTDFTVLTLLRDTSGNAVTAKTEADIDIAYARVETDNDVTTTDVTPAALTALTDAHTDWGFEEVSAVDHPGLYRLDIADAVFASGAWSAVVTITGTGLEPTHMEFELRTAPSTVEDIWTRAGSDLAAVPSATAGMGDMVSWLFMRVRNRLTETSTQQKLYKDDATTVAGTSTVSDNGTTFDRGEMA